MNDFIATVYFLEGDTESALKYWNRVGQPGINDIRIDPPLRMKPVLLDQAFTFSRGDQLTLDEYRTTRARLEGTGAFSRIEIELVPSQTNRFDAVLHGAERGKLPALSWVRGVPY